MGKLLSFLSSTSLLIFFTALEIATKEEKEKEYLKLVSDLNKEVDKLSDRITTLQSSLLGKRTNSKIYKAVMNEIKFKEVIVASKLEQIKVMSEGLLKSQTQLANIRARKGFFFFFLLLLLLSSSSSSSSSSFFFLFFFFFFFLFFILLQ